MDISLAFPITGHALSFIANCAKGPELRACQNSGVLHLPQTDPAFVEIVGSLHLSISILDGGVDGFSTKDRPNHSVVPPSCQVSIWAHLHTMLF
jgi:hypothetical protein